MCFNPSPERRVPSPNRYMAFARFCFCKNNKRTIITRRHETPNLDWNAEFRNAESRFSQLLYHGQTLVVQKLTESKFGIPKFGIPIEIRSLMSAGIGCIHTGLGSSSLIAHGL